MRLGIKLTKINMTTPQKFSRILLVVGTFLLSGFAFSQESMSADQIKTDWTYYMTQNGVEIYLKKEDCDQGAKELLTYAQVRFVNTTNTEKSVEFNFQLHHENLCVGCGNVDEYRKSVTVPANNSIEGDKTFARPELSLLIHNPYQIGVGAIQSIKVVQLIIE